MQIKYWVTLKLISYVNIKAILIVEQNLLKKNEGNTNFT